MVGMRMRGTGCQYTTLLSLTPNKRTEIGTRGWGGVKVQRLEFGKEGL